VQLLDEAHTDKNIGPATGPMASHQIKIGLLAVTNLSPHPTLLAANFSSALSPAACHTNVSWANCPVKKGRTPDSFEKEYGTRREAKGNGFGLVR
jgi:hypothetical protein